MGAVELASRTRRRDFSPLEAIDNAFERIALHNGSLSSFDITGFDDARRCVNEADRAIVAGDMLGPLHDLLTALKDLFDYRNLHRCFKSAFTIDPN